MFGRSTGGFDRALEKSTSQLLLEPDWDSILQICDCLRQGDVMPKYALTGLKKKLGSDNPHVAMFAMQVLESIVKNCGAVVHVEVATKEFMEFMKDLAKSRPDPVRGKILELIQVWSHAFRNEPVYKVVQDTYHLMKMEGYNFPALKEADAMFLSEKAPEWKDGECCHRCRVQFGMVQRKHHCRHCGQIFCNRCSAKSCIIPKFGIEREVRVCDACFDSLSKPSGKKAGESDELPPEYLASPLSQQSQAPPQKTEQELQEEEELMLALALSQSEAEAKEKNKGRSRQTSYGSNDNSSSSPASAVYAAPTVTASALDTSDMDPELARYLNRNYWEKKQSDVKSNNVTTTTTPSAPVAVAEAKTTNIKLQENGEVNTDQEQFLNALQSSIEIFVNRMKSNSQRGRPIANDSSVQTLFMTLNAMHPQLMKYMGEQEDARAHYESLQDKLAQLRDAREALDELRKDHMEKKRIEAEEMERQRQIQMAHKLEIMRQKKQEYLEYQRQLALQRMQEQEREMQMRLEQQKQMTQMRQMQQYAFPQVNNQFSPGGSVEGSPVHHLQQQQQPGAYGQPPMGLQGGPGQPPMGPPGAPPPAQQPPMSGPPGSQPPFSTAAGPPVYTQGYPMPPQANPNQTAQTTYPTPPGGYQPPTTTFNGQPMYPQGVPQPPPQGYPPTTGAGPAEYPSFNMQGMASALPQPPGQPPQQQQQYMAGPPAPPPQGQYPQGGAPPQQGLPPPGQQQQQPPQQKPEGALICFD